MTGGQILLVRHGRAGNRQSWEGDDRLRPLDRRGRRQASWLADELAARSVQRVLSSPYLRCTQTVEPLAERLGLELELCDALAEGGAWVPPGELAGPGAIVACTHGDVIVRLTGGQLKKGGVRMLHRAGGELVAGGELLPPK